MSRKHERMSFDYIAETCPAVSALESEFQESLGLFVERIKEVTSLPMRAALTEACADLDEARDRIQELEAELSRKDSELQEYRDLIRSMEAESA